MTKLILSLSLLLPLACAPDMGDELGGETETSEAAEFRSADPIVCVDWQLRTCLIAHSGTCPATMAPACSSGGQLTCTEVAGLCSVPPDGEGCQQAWLDACTVYG